MGKTSIEENIKIERVAAHKTARVDIKLEGCNIPCFVCGTSNMRVNRTGIGSHWATDGYSCPGVKVGKDSIKPNFNAIRNKLGIK
jgi:hypothetical protein